MRTLLTFSAVGLLAVLGISVVAVVADDAPVGFSNAAPTVSATNAVPTVSSANVKPATLSPGIYSASPCSMLVAVPRDIDPGMTVAVRDDVDPGMAVSVGGDFVPVMSGMLSQSGAERR